MEKKSAKHIRSALMINIIFTIVEILGAIFTNSIALLTESIRNIGDVLSIAVAYFLERRSQKRPKKEYTYGYARYSILGSIFSTFFLIISSIVVIITIIPRFIEPENINHEGMFFFAILGLILNGIGTFKTFRGKGINEQAVSLHLFEDLLSWLGVLFISIVMPIWNVPILDPLLSLIITVFIFRKGLEHLEEAFNIFLEKVPKNISIDDLKEKIKMVNHVIDIVELHVWTLDGIKDCATLKVFIDNTISLSKMMDVKEKIRCVVKEFHIEDITIELMFKEK